GRTFPERHWPASHFSRPRRNGVGAREPEGRHCRDGRDGLPSLPRSADALSRPGHRHVHGLDTSHRTPRTFPGGHRQARSVAVPQRADALTGETRTNANGRPQGARFIFASSLFFLLLARLGRRPLGRRRRRRRLSGPTRTLRRRWRRMRTGLRRRLHLPLLRRWRRRRWLHLRRCRTHDVWLLRRRTTLLTTLLTTWRATLRATR